MHKRVSLIDTAADDDEAMISRAIKNLTPLSLRIFLKNQLPARLVSAVAAPPPSTRRNADNVPKPIRPECPICGTSLPCTASQLDIQCTGCGALSRHRKLALAIYAYVKEVDTHVLVIGSDQVLQFICEGFEKVSFAGDPAEVPSELRSHVDLCIHSHWLLDSKMGPEKSLRGLDALLSPKGKQIFTIDASRRWHPIQWQRGLQAFLEWLHRKGWAGANLFEPDEAYGGGAGEVFGCSPSIEGSAAAVILPRSRVGI